MIANWTVENNLLRGLPAGHAPSPAALSAPGQTRPRPPDSVCWMDTWPLYPTIQDPGDIQLFTQSLIIIYLYLNWIYNRMKC